MRDCGRIVGVKIHRGEGFFPLKFNFLAQDERDREKRDRKCCGKTKHIIETHDQFRKDEEIERFYISIQFYALRIKSWKLNDVRVHNFLKIKLLLSLISIQFYALRIKSWKLNDVRVHNFLKIKLLLKK